MQNNHKNICLLSQSTEFPDNHKLTFKYIPFQNYMTFYPVLTGGTEYRGADKMFNCSFLKILPFMWEKYGRAGQDTDDNMAHAYCSIG